MASNQSIVEFITRQMAGAGTISARKMFGEYGIYCDGKMAALLCDDRLYVKITPGGRDSLGEAEEGPPYQGAKPCFIIPENRWEDSDWLAGLIRKTAAELPLPRKRPKAKSFV